MKAARTTLLLAGLAGAAATSAALADESRRIATLQPAKGMSFDVGSKRAVSYFLAKDGTCRLTVLLGEKPNEDNVSSVPATRVQLRIGPGEAARVDTAEGKALEFGCSAGANAMSVEALEQVAWAPAR